MSGRDAWAYESLEETVARLRAGRAHMGLSQAELAERIGVQEATIGRRENAQNIPDNAWGRAYLLEQLAKAGCPRDVLGLPAHRSLLMSGDIPVDLELALAAIRQEGDRAARLQSESEQSGDGTQKSD